MTRPKDSTPAILVCTSRITGKLLGVGLYSSEAVAKKSARSALDPDIIFSIWTPRMDTYATSCSQPFEK